MRGQRLRLAAIGCAQAALLVVDEAPWAWVCVGFAVGFGLAAWRAS